MEKDLALVEVLKPNWLIWNRKSLGSITVGDDVGFIGRDGDWYVPTGRALGAVNKIMNNQLELDIFSVSVGSIGAPLITQNGIVGMFLYTDGIKKAVGITIEEIKRFLSGHDHFFTLK